MSVIAWCVRDADIWKLHKISKPMVQHGTYSFYFWDADDNSWEILANPAGGYTWMFERGDQEGTGHMSRRFERPPATLRKAPKAEKRNSAVGRCEDGPCSIILTGWLRMSTATPRPARALSSMRASSMPRRRSKAVAANRLRSRHRCSDCCNDGTTSILGCAPSRTLIVPAAAPRIHLMTYRASLCWRRYFFRAPSSVPAPTIEITWRK